MRKDLLVRLEFRFSGQVVDRTFLHFVQFPEYFCYSTIEIGCGYPRKSELRIVILSEGVISELLPRIGLVDLGRDTDVDRQVRFPRTGVTSPRALSKLLPRFETVATAGTIIVPFEPPNIDDLLGSFGFHVRMAKFLDFENSNRPGGGPAVQR